MKYRKYLVIWFLLISLVILVDNYKLFGVEDLAKSVYQTFSLANKTQVITEFSQGESPTTITVENPKLKKGERAWLSKYQADGTFALDLKEYQINYDKYTGRPLSYQLIKEVKGAVAMVPNTYIKGTKAELGAFFNPKFSRYGVNCYGCSGQKSGHGNFSVGIGADVEKGVRQYNGKYKKGITFEGYYIVASDPSLPLCTVLEISNHNFKGMGLKPGGPFYAVVLDRGGAIKNNRLDFYIGDERIYNDLVKYSGRRKPLATIVYFGKRRNDSSGKRSCALPKIESLKDNATN